MFSSWVPRGLWQFHFSHNWKIFSNIDFYGPSHQIVQTFFSVIICNVNIWTNYCVELFSFFSIEHVLHQTNISPYKSFMFSSWVPRGFWQFHYSHNLKNILNDDFYGPSHEIVWSFYSIIDIFRERHCKLSVFISCSKLLKVDNNVTGQVISICFLQ